MDPYYVVGDAEWLGGLSSWDFVIQQIQCLGRHWSLFQMSLTVTQLSWGQGGAPRTQPGGGVKGQARVRKCQGLPWVQRGQGCDPGSSG